MPTTASATALELKDLAPFLLRQERARSDVDAKVIAPLLRGSPQLTAQRYRMEELVATHPVLSRRDYDFQSHSERYNTAVAKMFHFVQLIRTHAITDPVAQQQLYAAIGERLPIDVHRAMFIPTLENQADAQQQAKWLPLARTYKIIGAYAQTELGHGSNVQGIETTARFDVATQEFVVHSPTLTSRKWWPGGLGKTATHAIVHARLMLGNDKRDAGVQAFIVPLRSLATHEPLRGVELGDIGPKTGFHSVDNGWAAFDHVRVPRDHMLMRFAHVRPDGSFRRPPSDKLIYLTMVRVRASLVRKLAHALGAAATIATRFSAARVERFVRGVQRPLLDDSLQQLELLPRIALSYAATFASDALDQQHAAALAALEHRSNSNDSNNNSSEAFTAALAAVHATASGLKAWLADEVGVGIAALQQRCCCAFGALESSNLPHLLSEIVGASTYEGTFDVLVQQHARHLVKPALERLQTQKEANTTRGDASLRQRQTCSASIASDFDNVACLLEAFHVRAERATERLTVASLLQRSIRDDNDDSANPHMVLMTRASIATSEWMLLHAFAQRIDAIRTADAMTQATYAALYDLCALFGVWLLVRSVGDFRDDDYVSSAQSNLAQTHLRTLLQRVRRHAVVLTDAWSCSDWELRSTIGRFDGDMYRAIVTRTADEPLNHVDVAESYRPYLQSLMQASSRL